MSRASPVVPLPAVFKLGVIRKGRPSVATRDSERLVTGKKASDFTRSFAHPYAPAHAHEDFSDGLKLELVGKGPAARRRAAATACPTGGKPCDSAGTLAHARAYAHGGFSTMGRSPVDPSMGRSPIGSHDVKQGRGPLAHDGSLAGRRILVAPILVVALAALVATTSACRRRRDPCGDPVVAAQLFVDRLEAGYVEQALELLSRAALAELSRRAQKASRILRHEVTAADLLVPERSVLARSEWLALRSADDNEAWVEVRPAEDVGAQRFGPWSAQRLVLEDGCWRVDLFHPPPPAAPATDAGADSDTAKGQ